MWVSAAVLSASALALALPSPSPAVVDINRGSNLIAAAGVDTPLRRSPHTAAKERLNDDATGGMDSRSPVTVAASPSGGGHPIPPAWVSEWWEARRADPLRWVTTDGGPVANAGFSSLVLARPPPGPPVTADPRSWAETTQARSLKQEGRPSPPPSPPPPPPILRPPFSFEFESGFLALGGDLEVVNTTSLAPAVSRCAALPACRGVTYATPNANGTLPTNGSVTTVFLKSHTGRSGGAPWVSWVKTADMAPPARVLRGDGVVMALRNGTFAVQWLNVTGANYSFVPPLTPTTALPLVQHLGDCTLRVRPAGAAAQGAGGSGVRRNHPQQPAGKDRGKKARGKSSSGGDGTRDGAPQGGYTYFASAWGALMAEATPLPTNGSVIAKHDITPLLARTNATGAAVPAAAAPPPPTPTSWPGGVPVRVTRAYSRPADGGPGLEVSFTITNVATEAVELGVFGMATPTASGGAGTITTNVANDAHIGGQHGWVEWVRVVIDEQCVVATPLNAESALEAWRPVFEFGGGGFEWAVHTAAWAVEWERNQQWPFERMGAALNATGIWPPPHRSPWPSWGDGGQTVRSGIGPDSHWNPPTSRVLRVGESVRYGLRVSACAAGPRTRDAALAAVGEPVLRAVPGYTIATDMASAKLVVVSPPRGATVTGVSASNGNVELGEPVAVGGGQTVVAVRGRARGRTRVSVRFSDGTTAVAHYWVLPPLSEQVARVASHWADTAWLPRGFPDPFGRSASVMPWDREDGRHRFNDGRAYDVGLSDDAGAANNLGFASTQMFAPSQHAVSRVDEYIEWTLYGVKNDTAKPPFKSLQLPEPNNGVRMTLFYYNQTYFPWNYSEADECGVVAGLNYNWCMTEAQANATYRGFNYPHQVASYYAMYRVARNHDRLRTRQPWQWYLERAANTTLRLAPSPVGYMDGTVFREVLRSLLEENATAAAAAAALASQCGDKAKSSRSTDRGCDGAAGATPPRWNELATRLLAVQRQRAQHWSTTPFPYGSEFSYDTTGQEEVVVWLLYFGYEAAAKRTVDHVLSYMRHIPNAMYMGGAVAGDVANGGKWLVTAGTGVGDYGKMHYRAGLNQIPLSEWYRRHPDDTFLLEIAVGAQTGPLASVDESGAPAIYYHAYPHVQDHDAYSGDFGLGFFGVSLEASATVVADKALGVLCYLCDVAGGGASEGAQDTASAGATGAPPDVPAPIVNATSEAGFTVVPRDAYRQRVYLEPLGLFLQSDTALIASVTVSLASRTLTVAFAPGGSGAAAAGYSRLRLRADKVALPGLRPGRGFAVVEPKGTTVSRGAIEAPAAVRAITLSWQD